VIQAADQWGRRTKGVIMSTRIAAVPLVIVAAVALASCESSTAPLAPSPAAAESGGLPAGDPGGTDAATSRKPAGDGPIVIKHGELDFFGHLGGEVRLKDQHRGFSLIAFGTRTGGIVRIGCLAAPCAPGDVFPLNASWSDTDFHATVTLDGTTYTELGHLSGMHGTARISFNGSAVAPPVNKRGSAKVTAPFTMDGGFRVPDHPFMPYSGAGVATIWLEAWGTGWLVTRVLYEFRNQPPRVGRDRDTE
jgi:hypothetical protein